MTTTTNETRREVIIDTEIAKTHGTYADSLIVLQQKMSAVHYAANDRKVNRAGDWGMDSAQAMDKANHLASSAVVEGESWSDRNNRDDAIKAVAGADAARAVVDAAQAAFQTADEKYEGWARFFLVTNANGHIHSSMFCSTCHLDTGFAWLPTLSGLTEKDAVAEQGQRLCSVCFPSAPVEWTEGYYQNQKAEAKAERAAAKAAKAAKRAETYHYYTRFIRADGTVINHEDITTLKAGTKNVKERNAAPQGYKAQGFGEMFLVDFNTGEVVAS